METENTEVNPSSEDALEAVRHTFAVVEIMGHRQHVGIITDIEFLDTKMLMVRTLARPAVEEHAEPHEHVGWHETRSGHLITEAAPELKEQTYVYPPSSIFGLQIIDEAEAIRLTDEKRLRTRFVESFEPDSQSDLSIFPGDDDLSLDRDED